MVKVFPTLPIILASMSSDSTLTYFYIHYNTIVEAVCLLQRLDVYYVYNIRLKKKNALQKFLNRNKIITDIHYPLPPYKQNSIKHLFEGKKFPISEEIHQTNLSLPISFMNTKKEVEKVCFVANNF